MKAVLFVGHGSRDFEGNEQVRELITRIRPQMDPAILVESCFLEFELPTVPQGLDACVDKGATQVAVIPIMLLPAGHSKIHIPAALDEARQTYPDVTFTYGKPIGVHDQTVEICKSRLIELGEDVNHPDPDTAVILLGRGGSDPDANSDLYKIARLLWERIKYNIVEPAFMGVTDPLIEEGVDRCIRLGAKKIIILPYFLFTGILIKRLEELIQVFAAKYPDAEFSLAGYFGFHSNLERVLLERAEEALGGVVMMNCDTCQYRLQAMEHIDHHHHHDHNHNHDHDHHDSHEHYHHHDHEDHSHPDGHTHPNNDRHHHHCDHNGPDHHSTSDAEQKERVTK
ncbi:sirohydrochlorin chelatase [Aneurinibacillus sp. Ricciae_BoGa-3]|uniref:sirohydrochlorin chelatase n=1 Tax=Aneurinibacillus sp. Ricciae_BoGa-3 TaxID=3022697 RepID=UPI002340D356|nr:sirohydrochlorin chelatase [Aneurinibacillus sp. Ricciae_BoGa-3]WCK56470.1 sirohydrochlorin chelatase [Aneurinibacillus sp. Ricciae_BoGa-3]